MGTAILEHVNYTVKDSRHTAEMLCKLFGWKIRWSGPGTYGGHSIHVGTDDHYLAVYSRDKFTGAEGEGSHNHSILNHIGVVVDDLEAAEKRIKDAGYKTELYSDYEPGRRFYFRDGDNIEYEVVSYAPKLTSGPKTLGRSLGNRAKYAALMK